MLKSILAGLGLTAVTVMIHAAGTGWWIDRLVRRNRTTTRRRFHFGQWRILCSTATLLLLLHISEVAVWAVAYLCLPGQDSLDTLEESVYFSTVTFASLGFGDIVIQDSWRLLSGMEAMTGLLIFGWSTALLFAVVQRIWALDQSEM